MGSIRLPMHYIAMLNSINYVQGLWGQRPHNLRTSQLLQEQSRAWDLKNDYHIVKRYYRHCSQCGKRMHKALANEAIELRCPKCDNKNQANEFGTWD